MSYLKGMFRNRSSGDDAAGRRAEAAERPEAPAQRIDQAPAPSPFDRFGEQGESVGEQIAAFGARLDDLLSLRRDFGSVAEPMRRFIESHAEAQTRLAETAALLVRERADGQAARADALTLRSNNARLEDALAEAAAQVKVKTEAMGALASRLKSLEIAHDDAQSRLDWASRQMAQDTQSHQDQVEAARKLSDDVARLEQERALEHARMLELRDLHESAGSEVRRLQGLVERLQPTLAAAKRRISELETDAGATTATIAMVELKLAGEQEARRATDVARAQEKTAFESEIANHLLQIEALESRHATTSRLFEQSRSLLNDKIEEARLSERASKEAQGEKAQFERRLGAAQDEIRRLSEQSSLVATRQQDTQERCTMLTNALAAKDAQIEQLQSRAEAMKMQLDDAVMRYEQERATVEATNRKLIEEVQSERAERALAQGALSIARGSREKLLAQIEDLKKGRAARMADAGEAFPADEASDRNNIHRFRMTDPGDGL